MSDHALYKDKYCELTKTTLTISCYYVTMKPRMINLADIKAVYYEPHKFDLVNTNPYGMAFSPVWWAKDLKRQFSDGTNVVVDNGEKTLKGFSVKNIDEFMSYIKELLHPGVIIENHFPFSTDHKAESDE